MPRDTFEELYKDAKLGCPPGSEISYPLCLECPLPECQFADPPKKGRKPRKQKLTNGST